MDRPVKELAATHVRIRHGYDQEHLFWKNDWFFKNHKESAWLSVPINRRAQLRRELSDGKIVEIKQELSLEPKWDRIQKYIDNLDASGAIESSKHTQPNKKEQDMKTYNTAELTQKINPPAPEAPVAVQESVASLEHENVAAAAQVVRINNLQMTEQEAKITIGYETVQVPEKYSKRIDRLLADMRKDQEAILDETAAKLAKVAKVVG